MRWLYFCEKNFAMKNCDKTNEDDLRVLDAAFGAWMAWGDFRNRRARSKDFTYGRQWGDIVTDDRGRRMTERELANECGKEPMTNNLIRQLVKCVVGRFRHSIAEEKRSAGAAYWHNCVDEIDSRALEEFLISGCCVQRVEWSDESDVGVSVDNVNVNRFFSNVMEDARGWDCEIVGCLHDVRLGELIMRLADGDIATARRIKKTYGILNAVYDSHAVGQDSETGRDFWLAHGGKYRAIEVWTLELEEVLRCHDYETGQCRTVAVSRRSDMERANAARREEGRPEVCLEWRVEKVWHCRWFAPDGTLLRHYTSPYGHGSHPFVVKMYPLTDGEIHSMVEDVIDQQKYVNRLVTIIDHIMNASAKGVLLFPEGSLPEGFTWKDVRRLWSNSNSIIPYVPDEGGAVPQQVVAKNTDIGAYELLSMQMRLIEEISGVTSVLRGNSTGGNSGVKLYESQVENADVSLADIYETFASFRRQRDEKAKLMANFE